MEPVIHLKASTASWIYSCDLTGSQCSSFISGVTLSNFLVPQIIRAAKFWTAWSLRRLVFTALDQKEEKKKQFTKH